MRLGWPEAMILPCLSLILRMMMREGLTSSRIVFGVILPIIKTKKERMVEISVAMATKFF